MEPYRKGKEAFTTLGIALGGVYATSPNPYSEDTAVSISIPDNRLYCYLGDLKNGGVVIDKRMVKTSTLINETCSGPYLRESLKEGTMAKGLTYPKEVVKYDAKKVSGIDYVALDIYLSIWRKHGARIGVRKGKYILWEDGEKKLIPLEEDRNKETKLKVALRRIHE